MASKSATVRIEILGDAKNLKKALGEAERSTSSFGANVKKDTQLLGKWAVGAVTAVVGIGAAIAGLAIKGGIDRALKIENAQAKLKGLGHDTKAIEKIMVSALDSVKGTAFGLDEAAQSAASAIAAGVEPGEDLTRVLGLTADAATIMGRSFGESGAIVNKVLASNRLSMEEVNQLHDAGLPILSMLAEQYGVTAEAMRKMVSDGEVDSVRFLQAIETNIGGAALASGDTTVGAFANMRAAMSRFGETLVKDLLPVAKLVFEQVGAGFDRMAGVFKPVMDEFGKSGVLESFKGAISDLPDMMERLAEGMIKVWENTKLLRDIIKNTVTGAFIILESWLGKTALAVLALHKAMLVLKSHPVIAGLGLLALAVGAVNDKMKEGEQEAGTLADQWGELNRAAREMALIELFTPGQLEVLRDAGFTMQDLTETSINWKDVLEAVGDVQYDNTTASGKLSDAWELENSTLQELVDAQAPHIAQLKEETAEYARNRDAGRHRGEVLAGSNKDLASSLGEVEDAQADLNVEVKTGIELAQEAFDQNRRQTDAVFGLRDALDKQAEAETIVNDLVNDGLTDTPKYTEAVRDWAEANMDVKAAQQELITQGGLTREEFVNQQIALGLTRQAAEDLAAEYDELFTPRTVTHTINIKRPVTADNPSRVPGNAQHGGRIHGPTIVGEAGPEVFVPDSAGTVIPNHRLGNGNGNGSPLGGTTIYLSVSSLDPQAAGRAVVEALQSWQRSNGDIPITVRG